MTFTDFFMTDTVEGDFSYTAIHWISFAAVAAIAAVLAFVAGNKKISDRAKDITVVSIAVFQLAFEVGWRILYLYKGNSLLSLWPFYPCNLVGFVLPLALIFKSERMKDCFYIFGFIGGVLIFVYPVGIFVTPYLQFYILKSILQHTGILFIPIFEYVRGTYRPRLENFGYVLLGLVIHIANSYGVSTLLGFPGDYMYIEVIPFAIPGVPQFFTTGALAVAVLFLLCWAFDPKGIYRIVHTRRVKEGGTPSRNDVRRTSAERGACGESDLRN